MSANNRKTIIRDSESSRLRLFLIIDCHSGVHYDLFHKSYQADTMASEIMFTDV